MVKKFHTNLSNAKHSDSERQKALKFAKRCHAKVFSNDLSECHQPPKLRFCEIGAERKSKTLEVREAMFQRFTVVKEKHSRLDKRVFQDCMKEYNISLRKSNKRYVIKNEDRVEEIQNYLNGGEKIFIRMVKKYSLDIYGVAPPIINEDQITEMKGRVKEHFQLNQKQHF